MTDLISSVLTCCIFLPLCASAETNKERINASEIYLVKYQSNTERTKITVDATMQEQSSYTSTEMET